MQVRHNPLLSLLTEKFEYSSPHFLHVGKVLMDISVQARKFQVEAHPSSVVQDF